MKKLLVILMLGAGFVTVASADNSRDCTTDTTNNQCCVDVSALQSAFNQTPYYVKAIVGDGNVTRPISTTLTNDGTDGEWCKDEARYVVGNQPPINAEVFWQPGNWVNSIQLDRSSSANKDNAIIIIPGNKDKAIITNN